MLNRNAELTADYFCIPAPQVDEIGNSVEISGLNVLVDGEDRLVKEHPFRVKPGNPRPFLSR